MKGSDGFVQGYNTQVAVEPLFQLIVGQTVTQATNDKQQVVPLIEAIQEQSGQRPQEVLTDNGYCSEENLKYLAKRRMEGFVATEKQKHGERNKPCKRGPLPEDASRVERMKRKLKTKVGAAVYARRKCMVEPVFGQIKQARGLRQFLLQSVITVKINTVIAFLWYSISDESRRDFERYFPRSFDIDGELRFAWCMSRWERPSFKTNRCNRLVIEFYDAALSEKPIVGL